MTGHAKSDQPTSDANKGSIEEPTWPLQGNLMTEEVTQWYRPSWRDGLRHLGYRWVVNVVVTGIDIVAPRQTLRQAPG